MESGFAALLLPFFLREKGSGDGHPNEGFRTHSYQEQDS